MSNTPNWNSLIGQTLGSSDWLTIDQDRINRFASVTEDHQFIHVNPEMAARTPFGGTIAHGFLTLSLLPRLMYPLLTPYSGNSTIVNYGSNKLRFLAPVKCDSRIRLHMALAAVNEKSPNKLLTLNSTMEIEGQSTPALVAETLMMVIDNTAGNQ